MDEIFASSRPRPPRGRSTFTSFESVRGLRVSERINASVGRRPTERAWVCLRADSKSEAIHILTGMHFWAISERHLRRSWINPEAPPPLRFPTPAVLFWYESEHQRSSVYVLTDTDVGRFPPVAVASWAWNGVTDSGAQDVMTFDEVTPSCAAVLRPDLIAGSPSTSSVTVPSTPVHEVDG